LLARYNTEWSWFTEKYSRYTHRNEIYTQTKTAKQNSNYREIALNQIHNSESYAQTMQNLKEGKWHKILAKRSS
jgi:hypothetical protein